MNERKCAMAHVKRGKLETPDDLSIKETDVIESLNEGRNIKTSGIS